MFQRQRRREAAAVTLQAWTRGVLSQRETRCHLRHQCDALLSSVKTMGITEATVTKLIALMIRIFNPTQDSERLVK